ncbi:MAG TPA: hypothetical protein VH062_12745 [Polyangiaceae bacterium]|nr:hypothetical protein [Polyangiaceae bacterium]
MRSHAPGLVPALAWLLASAMPRTAFATDVSDELSAGALSSSSARGSSPFVSDKVGGAIDASDKLDVSADATFTRYFKSKGASAENILQLAAATDFSPNEHLSFGADVRGSPPSSASVAGATTGTRDTYRSSLIGGGLSAEYDTAGDGDAESIADGYVGLTSFHTTQRSRAAKRTPSVLVATPSSLLQWRASLGFTEILWRNTEAGLTGTYYLYSADPVDTGYYGPSVLGRGGVSEGVPLEPLRWALRPTVRQRIGPVRLTAYVQYGRYVDNAGYSVLTAVKATLKVSDPVRLWAQFGFQRDGDSTGESLSVPWGSVGVRVML